MNHRLLKCLICFYLIVCVWIVSLFLPGDQFAALLSVLEACCVQYSECMPAALTLYLAALSLDDHIMGNSVRPLICLSLASALLTSAPVYFGLCHVQFLLALAYSTLTHNTLIITAFVISGV